MKRSFAFMVTVFLLSTNRFGVSKPTPEEDAVLANMGKCECGVFEHDKVKGFEPVIRQVPINVTCDSEGSTNCNKLCSALAIASKDQAPQLLCSQLKQAENMIPSMYTRTCDKGDWLTTGLSSEKPICCKEGAFNDCKV